MTELNLRKKTLMIIWSALVIVPVILMFPAIWLMPSALPILVYIFVGPFSFMTGFLAFRLARREPPFDHIKI